MARGCEHVWSSGSGLGAWSPQVQEHKQEDLDPGHGGGTVAVTTKYEAHELKLWTHPHDDCCPLRHVEVSNVSPRPKLEGTVCMLIHVRAEVLALVCVSIVS